MILADFDLKELVKHRLTAYIHPKKAISAAQKEAFEKAVSIQAAYEEASEADDSTLPSGIDSVSIGDFTVSAAAKGASEYTRDNLHPAAWALLYNAKLIPGAIPQARRV